MDLDRLKRADARRAAEEAKDKGERKKAEKVLARYQTLCEQFASLRDCSACLGGARPGRGEPQQGRPGLADVDRRVREDPAAPAGVGGGNARTLPPLIVGGGGG